MTDRSNRRHGARELGFAGNRPNSQSAARAFPVAPHPSCWATSPRPVSFSPLSLSSLSSPPSTTTTSASILSVCDVNPPSYLFYLQNVCSCCFLRHLQGGQRRMLFEPLPVVVIFLYYGKNHNKHDNLSQTRERVTMLIAPFYSSLTRTFTTSALVNKPVNPASLTEGILCLCTIELTGFSAYS